MPSATHTVQCTPPLPREACAPAPPTHRPAMSLPGNRPLSLGVIGEGTDTPQYVAASESCVFGSIDATLVREVCCCAARSFHPTFPHP